METHVDKRRGRPQHAWQLCPAHHTVGRTVVLEQFEHRLLMPARVPELQCHLQRRWQLPEKVGQMSIVAREWLSVTSDDAEQAWPLQVIIIGLAILFCSGNLILMLASLLLPDVPTLRLDTIATDDQTILLTMTSTQLTAACPVCANSSERIH